jgi:hypothetical protein
MLLIVASSAAKAQGWDDYEPRTGPGLGGHRNDGIALMFGAVSGTLGLATLVRQPTNEGGRTLAGFAAVVGLGSAVAGEMMRQNRSARPGFTAVATGFGVLTAAIGTTKLFRPARSGMKEIEISPTIDGARSDAGPKVGFSGTIRF